MKLGGLLRGYHPARKCLKTGRDEEWWGIKIGSADFIKDETTVVPLFSHDFNPYTPLSAPILHQSTQVTRCPNIIFIMMIFHLLLKN